MSIFAMLPAMLSLLLLGIISFEWWLGDSGEFAKMFLTGKYNQPFVSILFSTGILSMAIMMASQLALVKYTSKIDRLDEAEMQAWEAKRKYDAATRKLVENIK